MQEKMVTIGDTTYNLKELLFFIATMNPVEQEGTFSLPEATLDRFAMLLDMRYVSRNDEKKMLRMHVDETEAQVEPVTTVAELLEMRQEIRRILKNVSEPALDYIVDLARATRPEDEKFNEVHARPHPEELRVLSARNEQPLTVDMLREMIKLGGSPRTEIWTLRCAAAHAFIRGAQNIEPDDVKAVFRDVARGRIMLSPAAEFEGYTSDKVIDAVLARVPVIR
jgi:MoxR-like ATPase